MSKPHVVIYTDGSCNPSTGQGGCCAYVEWNKTYIVNYTGEYNTTNNRMELLAAILGLQSLIVPCKVDIYADSQYVINGFEKRWVQGWMRNNWKNGKGENVKNRDLWERLYELVNKHSVKFYWVKGHRDDPYNNFVDAVAGHASHNLTARDY